MALPPTMPGRAAQAGGVYVLQFGAAADKYYVGKSDNVDARIRWHMDEQKPSVQWVAYHGGGKKVVSPMTPRNDDLNAWEQKETVERMIVHGIDNVRGWEFTTTGPLSSSECEMVKKLHMGFADLCRKCGRKGHMASSCYARTKDNWLFDIDNRIEQMKRIEAPVASRSSRFTHNTSSFFRRQTSYRHQPYARGSTRGKKKSKARGRW